MVTRFRLTSDATAPAVSPAIQSYTHEQGSRRKLLTSDASALTTSAYSPDAADDLVSGDSHHIQFVSDPMDSGLVFTSGNTLKYAIQGIEPSAGDNMRNQIFVSIVDSAGTTVQATIRSKVVNTANELSTVLTNKFHTTTLSASYTTVANDRLVVEFSVQGTPTAGAGIQGHNASQRWGSDGAGGDLPENQTETGTTLNPWIEFVTDITFPSGGAATVTPAVVASITTLPIPAILAASNLAPAVIPIVASLPTPAILAAAQVSPAAVPVVVALPTPTILAGAKVTPAVIPLVVTLPTPTIVVEGATVVTPAVIAVVASLPTPAILAEAKVTPAFIPLAALLPTPTVVAGAAGVATPAVIAATVGLPTPSVTTDAVVTPAGIALVVTVPTPGVTTPGLVTPAGISLIATLPTPGVTIGAVTFWEKDPVLFVKVGPGDDPPWN